MESISEMSIFRNQNVLPDAKMSKQTDVDNILESQYDGKTAGTRL